MDFRNDMTLPADLHQHFKGTGHLRTQRPVYMDFMPPCNSACPIGENIQGWFNHAQAGNYFEAFQVIMEDNPFPAIMGRICVKPCEKGCNRNHIDDTVNIHAVERYIGDEALRQNWQARYTASPSGKKVLVIGAGPSGLSAAYHLKRMGHEVEVMDANAQAGGLMWQGVPEYRLPKDVLNGEIARIEKMGVKISLNKKVTDVLAEKAAGNFDAVYLAIGAQLIQKEKFETDGSVFTTTAFDFFNERRTDELKYYGKRVLVHGGNKLALYIARIVKRFGSMVSVFYEGDRKMMPAYDYETDDALAEGVDVNLNLQLKKIEKNNASFEKTKIEKGKVVGTGEFQTIEADIFIMANRQEVDARFLRSLDGMKLNEDGTIVIDADRMTGHPGIFAGGDMLPGENRSSAIATGHGKKAAKFINGFLRGEPFVKGDKHATAGYRKLHIWYKTEAPLKEQERQAPAKAIQNFDEIVKGLSEEEANYEAMRCLSCGNCFECDGCYGSCPEDAIIKLGPGLRYEYDYNKCTGCAVCFEQCPCHAIEMVPEGS